jgi:hypothetical protein
LSGECDSGAGDLTSAVCDKIASDNQCTTHTFSTKPSSSCSNGVTGCCDYTDCKKSPPFVQYKIPNCPPGGGGFDAGGG